MNLTADLAQRLEQDPDYQILRKSFALDRQDSPRLASDGSGAGGSGRISDALALELGHARFETGGGEGSIVTLDLDLQVAWSRESVARFTRSASGDVSLTLRSDDLRRQGLELEMRQENANPVQTGDPLVLDLSGKGITTTGIEAGVQFDLTGDGRLEQVSFVTGDSWLLALDQNANGRIDDGRELFGDQQGASHGFEALARHDSNGDGLIDAGDEVFARLRLFQVAGDGQQVLSSLSESGVTAIELGHQNVRKALNLYDSVAQIGQFRRADGRTGEAADLLLGYRPGA